MQFIEIPTEQTTAATDVLLALLAAVCAMLLRRFRQNDSFKVAVWTWTFTLVALAAALGAVAHGFEMEHENVYYRINLDNHLLKPEDLVSIEIKENELTQDDKQYFKVFYDNMEIGGAQVTYLRNVNLVYLTWIWISKEYNSKGIGSSFMKTLFDIFVKQGYTQMDIDTANDNVAAQRYYEKNGFSPLGFTRSYIRVKTIN